MKNTWKKLLTGSLAILMMVTSATTVLANPSRGDIIEEWSEENQVINDGMLAYETEFEPQTGVVEEQNESREPMAQSNSYTIPGNKGTLTSNAWRTYGDGNKVGNTRQWDYQVSAYYSGNRQVEWIKTSWMASASLRNGGSLTLGVSGSGANAGGSSSWQTVIPAVLEYTNSRGQKEVSYRSNMYVSPEKDYRSNTISIANTAIVKLKDDSKTYRITAAY